MKIVKYLFPTALLLFLLTACSQEATIETLDSTDFLPQSKHEYQEIDPPNTTTETTDSLSAFEKKLKERYPMIDYNSNNHFQQTQQVFLPNRLGYIDKQEAYFTLDTVDFHYLNWTFEDSAKVVNAFYNWIDCFGKDCISFRIGESIKVSDNAFQILVASKNIIFLESSTRINDQEWKGLFQLQENEKVYFHLRQARMGKIKWEKQ